MVLSNRYTALQILVSHSTGTKIGCSVHCKIVQIRVILKYKLFTLNYIYALELIIYLLIYLDSLRIYLHGCKKILLYLAIVAHWQSLRNVYMSARCYALYHYGNGNYLLVQKYLMPCPFKGPKIFWASPIFLCQTKNLFTYCVSHKYFVQDKKMICIQ